jgi:hypothetical protein
MVSDKKADESISEKHLAFFRSLIQGNKKAGSRNPLMLPARTVSEDTTLSPWGNYLWR